MYAKKREKERNERARAFMQLSTRKVPARRKKVKKKKKKKKSHAREREIAHAAPRLITLPKVTLLLADDGA